MSDEKRPETACAACLKPLSDGDETYLRLTLPESIDNVFKGTMFLCRACFGHITRLTMKIDLVDPRPPKPTPGKVYGFEQSMDPIVHVEWLEPREERHPRSALIAGIGYPKITLRTRSGINIPVVGQDGLQLVTIKKEDFDTLMWTEWVVFHNVNGERIGHPLDPNYTHRIRIDPYY